MNLWFLYFRMVEEEVRKRATEKEKKPDQPEKKRRKKKRKELVYRGFLKIEEMVKREIFN